MEALNTPTYVRLREALRRDIVDGIWQLGAHITLTELAKHYQVSQAPVREALLQLQGEGVVAMRVNKGAVIPTVDAQYIDNIYRVRGAIQSMLAKEAALRAMPAQIAQMRLLSDQHFHALTAGDVPASVKANREFHRYVDSVAGNSLALELLEGRSSLVDAFRRSVGYGVGRLEVVRRQHDKLVDAIAKGDGDLAAQLILEHTDLARLDLMAKAVKAREA
ncbi:GntR family transcriptional regulator [Acidovorax sp. LjRoot194]|uniref:GntR family transcriptional regulator n=1 Tax=Acidovorax sp. LjRoot194 TaxID=3342280 RepID=UPI003ECDE990